MVTVRHLKESLGDEKVTVKLCLHMRRPRGLLNRVSELAARSPPPFHLKLRENVGTLKIHVYGLYADVGACTQTHTHTRRTETGDEPEHLLFCAC